MKKEICPICNGEKTHHRCHFCKWNGFIPVEKDGISLRELLKIQTKSTKKRF